MGEHDDDADFDPKRRWAVINNEPGATRLCRVVNRQNQYSYNAEPRKLFLDSKPGRIWIFLEKQHTLYEIADHVKTTEIGALGILEVLEKKHNIRILKIGNLYSIGNRYIKSIKL
jgi:hypothetical protein